MNLKSLRNKPSRNGFDLSFKRNFTAKAGELLPVMVKEVLPGDVFNIDLSSFTRTQQLILPLSLVCVSITISFLFLTICFGIRLIRF